jgi:hypothetical protein
VTYPEISFRSELLAWVPAGWRAVGRLQVKNAEQELACRLALHLGGTRQDGSAHPHHQQLGHRLQVDNPPVHPRTRPPHPDDVLMFPRTGHVSRRVSFSGRLFGPWASAPGVAGRRG